MKKFYQKTVICLLALLCAFSLVSCGAGAENSAQIAPEMEEYLVQTSRSLFENTVHLVGSEYEEQAERIPLYEKSMESWKSAQEAVGEVSLSDVSDVQVEKVDEETYEVQFRVDGTGHDAIIVTRLKELYDEQQRQFYISPESVVTNVDYSFGELLGQAGLNTILGMGTTFLVLILLTLIISLFGVLNRYQLKKQEEAAREKAAKEAEEKKAESEKAAAVPEALSASADAARAHQAEEATDPMLIAAAAGALAASEAGRPPFDGITISPMPSDPALVAVIAAAAHAAASQDTAQAKPAPDVFVARRFSRRPRRK